MLRYVEENNRLINKLTYYVSAQNVTLHHIDMKLSKLISIHKDSAMNHCSGVFNSLTKSVCVDLELANVIKEP